jgi:hypothetical protein
MDEEGGYGSGNDRNGNDDGQRPRHGPRLHITNIVRPSVQRQGRSRWRAAVESQSEISRATSRLNEGMHSCVYRERCAAGRAYMISNVGSRLSFYDIAHSSTRTM